MPVDRPPPAVPLMARAALCANVRCARCALLMNCGTNRCAWTGSAGVGPALGTVADGVGWDMLVACHSVLGCVDVFGAAPGRVVVCDCWFRLVTGRKL